LRIAIVVNSFPETSETFIVNKVLALASAGHTITVVRLNKTGNPALRLLYKLNEQKNIEIIDPLLPGSPLQVFSLFIQKPALVITSFNANKKAFLAKLREQIFKKLFNSGFDIVHFEFSGVAIAFLGIIKQIKPHVVVSCRGSAEKVKLLSEPKRAEQLKKVFDKVSAIHCVSTDMKNTIEPYCNNLSKVFINRPAIDPFFFKPEKSKHDFDGTIILSIGRFTFQKGYLFGLMAIHQLVSKGHAIQWHIIGDGPQHEEMLYHIHSLHLSQHVILEGKKNKDEVNAWYNKADVFLLTSVYEGIPNVVLEAMAMELPVVATRSGGVDEVIEHTKDGYIAEVYNVQSIVAGLESVLSNQEHAKQMGKLARKKILDAFTIERQVNVFEQQYNLLKR
jgi:colanic acid/amylovoran biosynthesis glycosyltransferase